MDNETTNLAGIYLLKVNNRSTSTSCEICSKLTIKTLELRQACNFIKKVTLAQMFSCGFCEIFKNTFFTENTSGRLLLNLSERKKKKRQKTRGFQGYRDIEIKHWRDID